MPSFFCVPVTRMWSESRNAFSYVYAAPLSVSMKLGMVVTGSVTAMVSLILSGASNEILCVVDSAIFV